MKEILIIQNCSIVGPGRLKPALEKAGFILDIRIMDKSAVLPLFVEKYAALIILGGSMNVYEEKKYPHLKQVEQLIKDAVHQEKTVLGTCLGGQLIAKSLGANVSRNHIPEIGWYPLQLTTEGKRSPLFKGLPEEFNVFQWHNDTFALPEEANILAKGVTCVNQAFAFGNRTFSLQFHVEIVPDMVFAWTKAFANDLDELGGAEATQQLEAKTLACEKDWAETADTILDNLVNIINDASTNALNYM